VSLDASKVSCYDSMVSLHDSMVSLYDSKISVMFTEGLDQSIGGFYLKQIAAGTYVPSETVKMCRVKKNFYLSL
jgi:hypothetical protein